MRYSYLLILLIFSSLPIVCQTYQVTVEVRNFDNTPLDRFHRVFFYRGVNLVYTKSLNNQGQCYFSITPRQIDTIGDGNQRVSYWQAVVMSSQDIPLQQKSLTIDIDNINNLPIQRLTLDSRSQSLYGVLTDRSDNSPITNASVTIQKSRTIQNTKTIPTDSYGNFNFEGLPLGNYNVELSFSGALIAKGQKASIYLPNPNSQDIRLEVYPSYNKVSWLPIIPLTRLSYPNSRFLFAGETLSIGVMAISFWGVKNNKNKYLDAGSQRAAAIYNTRGNGFKTALIMSGTTFLTSYLIKLTNRKKHKPKRHSIEN